MMETMARWQPDAKARLVQAAQELFALQGPDETTVAEIAERAGLNKRTFFRYFTDKREVLFAGQPLLEDLYIRTIAAAPAGATPMGAVAPALVAAGALIDQLGEIGRQRQRLIAESPSLQERESIKRAASAAAIRNSLRERGVVDAVASLTAETAVGMFKVAYARWGGSESLKLETIVAETVALLGDATAT
jgi:AcrR family transcriptional regulator